MEHIRTEHAEDQPYFYFPRLGPRWEKKGLEPILEEEQRGLLWYGLGTFGCFMALNLPLSLSEGPGVRSEDGNMGDSY